MGLLKFTRYRVPEIQAIEVIETDWRAAAAAGDLALGPIAHQATTWLTLKGDPLKPPK